MKPSTALATLAALLGVAAQDHAGAQESPFPRFMPGYEWQSSLVMAIDAARGKKKVVVYSVDTVTLRNRVPWLMEQRAIFRSPLTREVLRGIPIVAVQSDGVEAKRLRVPRTGLSVLSPDGSKVEVRIDFDRVEFARVPAALAEVLTGKPPARLSEVIDARAEFARFRDHHARIMNAIDAGTPQEAEALCRSEEQRMPDGIGPRLLRQALRERTLGRDAPGRLPAPRPVRDVLCVVPDLPTFLRAIEAWRHGPIFPVLFADSHYLPLFLEAFRPARVLVVARDRTPEPTAIDTERVYRSYGRAFGDRATRDERSAVELWRGHPQRSPGAVFTHPDSPMLAAGVALAAARRQILAMLAPVPDPTRRVDFAGMVKIRDEIQALFGRHLIEAGRMYDEVDFITLATEEPYRYTDSLAADRSTLAVDDAIARDRFDFPQAFVGRLLGDHRQSLYMAMCALFLQPRSPLLFSRYPGQGSWAAYGTSRAEKLLQKSGLQVRHVEFQAATLTAWLDLFREAPSPYDLVHVNSSGGSRNWSTSSGNGSYDDLPLTVPAIVSYVHSNSLGNGYDSDTVGGRWLHNGAYSFFGSISEPYLDAFVNVYAVYRRAYVEGRPLAMAHRLLPLQLRWRPWKLMYFGDPLIRLQQEVLPRIAEPPALDGAVPLAEAGARNPFRLRGLEQQVFAAWSTVLQGGSATGAVTRLLQQLPRNPAVPAAIRRDLADLVALSCLKDGGLARLRGWLGPLRKADLQSRRLSYVAHTLCRARLDTIARDRNETETAREIERLALEHVGFEFSPAMYKRIGELYRPVLNRLPQGKRLRSRIGDLAKKQARDPAAIRPFLSAL